MRVARDTLRISGPNLNDYESEGGGQEREPLPAMDYLNK